MKNKMCHPGMCIGGYWDALSKEPSYKSNDLSRGKIDTKIDQRFPIHLVVLLLVVLLAGHFMVVSPKFCRLVL